MQGKKYCKAAVKMLLCALRQASQARRSACAARNCKVASIKGAQGETWFAGGHAVQLDAALAHANWEVDLSNVNAA